MVLSQVVDVPLLLDLLIVHGGEGVITLTAYSADFVRTFPNGIHFFLSFSAGSDEGFS